MIWDQCSVIDFSKYKSTILSLFLQAWRHNITVMSWKVIIGYIKYQENLYYYLSVVNETFTFIRVLLE